MSMNYDIAAVYQFISQTPEGGLRKLLQDPQNFTEIEFNMIVKITRACNESQFIDHCVNSSFPKVKFSANEVAKKEQFWGRLIKVLDSRGLLAPASASKAA